MEGSPGMEMATDEPSLPTLAERFLSNVRSGAPDGHARERIASIPESRLDDLDECSALAFWITLYNAATGATLLSEPETFEHKRTFFSKPIVTVAGEPVSLDRIEHGILRGSRWKYGFGYVPNPFPSAFVRRHRLAELDPRIHFALNCGAAACPPVSVYTPDAVDEQLDLAAESYLRAETVVDGDVVRVPRLLLWYRGDFGGGSGIRSLLREHGVIDPDGRPRIRYREYDWSRDIDAFLEGGVR